LNLNNHPEVLAPAGSPEQLIAAVRSGADAVYLGAGSMNARQSAQNFSDSELMEAAAYCREYGVRLYVVMNTLLFDDELEQAGRLFELVCSMPADGVIVQDVGLASLMRKAAPDMPLHASTQMTIHSPAALNTLHSMGFSRAVLARELSGEELSQMAADSPLELEVFVHGALCMCVSGQCYLSAMLGGRSGNRGRCAQPCRLPFRSGEREYALSLKDMSHVQHIERLSQMGIRSLKIEGRMKRPEYCAAASAVCSAAAKGEEIPQKLADSLSAVFSRSGFTDGYFTARRGSVMFGYRTKDDVTAADSSVLSSLHELYKKERSRVPLDMKAAVHAGKPVELTASDADGNSVTVSGDIPQVSDGGSLSAEQLSARLSKTGGTAFVPRNISCDVEDGLFLPASAVNGLRRQAVEQLTAQRRAAAAVECNWQQSGVIPHAAVVPELHAVFADPSQIPEVLPDHVRRIYLPLECDPGVFDRMRASGCEVCVEAPRGLFGNEQRIRELLDIAHGHGVEVCMIHNIGLIEPVLSAGMIPYGGFGLNITNTAAIEEFERLGLAGAELSFELTLGRIAALGGKMPRGVIVYGYLPLMLTRNCPSALSGCPGRPCSECGIVDRRGVRFATRCRMGCTEVYNSVPLDMTGREREISGAEHHIMRFTVEDTEQVLRALRASRKGGAAQGDITRGLYYRGVE